MFDRIAPVYDAMNRVMTVGLDLRWRRLAAARRRPPGRPRARRRVRHRRPRARRRCARARASVTGLDFSERMLERARRKSPAIAWVQGDLLALPFEDAIFDAATVGFGIRNVADLELGLRELRRVLRPGRPARDPRDHAAAGLLRPFFSLWFDRRRAAARAAAAGRRGLRVPAGVGAPLPARRGARRAPRARPASTTSASASSPARSSPCTRGGARDRARRRRRHAGLAAYMAELEVRLAQAVGAPPGLRRRGGGEALAAGGKRLRPLLCFLASPSARGPPLAAGVAVELVHMATLVHDDLVDGARMRRGAPAAWSVFGAGRRARRRATTSSPARSPSSPRPATRPRSRCSPTPASPRARRGAPAPPDARPGDADRRLPRALRAQDRQALRGGLPARLGRRPALGEYGLALGIAFQIADDILDCAGQTQETGKIPGTDLREGTPTMPLLLAARRTTPSGGARRRAARRRLVRVAATDALTRSREAALEYASKARFLGADAHRDELEALTYAVVDRAAGDPWRSQSTARST